MLQPNRFVPWLAAFAFVLFVLLFQMVVKPLPFATGQPQIAAWPSVQDDWPPAPAWPVQGPTVTRPALSLMPGAG